MRGKLVSLYFLLSINVFSQEVEPIDSLTLIFMGDIMGHGPQIKSAFDTKTMKYNYEGVFSKISPLIENADIAIANLELTLAGKPYTGYPQFSSPDELAVACKNSGIDMLVTANNHSCDRGKKGIVRTLSVLDSLGLYHTGTFRDSIDWKKHNLFVLDKNNIKVGILNYTFGTNGLPIPRPTIVNLIDTLTMLTDIKKSREALLDKLIVVLHWGQEYQSQPSDNQKEVAKFLFKNGVDIIVGSHPHVLQKMEYFKENEDSDEQFIAYSLGNFVSNQRIRKRDGGAMLQLTLKKRENEVKIANCGYYLTWVYKSIINGKIKYEIVPSSIIEASAFDELDSISQAKMRLFIDDSRALFTKENQTVGEIVTSPNVKHKSSVR